MKKILIVHPEGSITTNPNLSAIAELLHKQGYRVDVLLNERAERRDYKSDFFRIWAFEKINIHQWGKVPRTAVVFLLSKLGGAYGLIIGIDQPGIIIANAIASASHVPKAMISYEIFYASEIGSVQKNEEILACQDLSFVICQDEIRAKQLATENHIDKNRILCIPVAGGSWKKDASSRSSLRRRHGIDDNKNIAIYIGSFEKWAGFDILLQEIHLWPDNWVLVLHGKDRADRETYHKIEVHRISSGGKLIFSDEPFATFSELCEYVSGADLGIALYYPDYANEYTGGNLKCLGLSSGKISTYLNCSLPVIVNEVGTMSDQIRMYSLGHVVSDGMSIGDILFHIERDELLAARQRCKAYFENHLAFDNYAAALMKLIDHAFLDTIGSFRNMWSELALRLFERLSKIVSVMRSLPIFKKLLHWMTD